MNMLPIKRKMVKVAGPAVTKLTKIPMPEDTVFDELEKLTERLEALKALLSDAEQVSLRIVTTTERIVIRETKRNFTWLHLYGYNVDAIIVNRLYPESALRGYFSRWGQIQEQGLEEIGESFAHVPIFTLTLKESELKSPAKLLAAAQEIYGDVDPLPVLAVGKIFELTHQGTEDILTLYLPFADKADIELAQKDGELFISVQNARRRLLLPEALRGKEVQSARYESGRLSLTLR